MNERKKIADRKMNKRERIADKKMNLKNENWN